MLGSNGNGKKHEKNGAHESRPLLTIEQILKEQEKIRKDTRSFGDKVADGMAAIMGSWPFIIGQTIFILFWMIINVIGFIKGWDPYPFILLNLVFSIQAAYSAPIIMMSQNRQSDRDREQAKSDYRVNQEAEARIITIQNKLDHLEATLATAGGGGDTDDASAASNVLSIQDQLNRIESMLSLATIAAEATHEK